MNKLTIEEKLKIIHEIGEEITEEKELIHLLHSSDKLVAYDGFEPSGQMHIAQGILRTINVNKMIKTGFHFKMLVADWFAFLNNKMGGDIEKIQIVGKYFIEIWKACGMDIDNVEFVWTSNVIKDTKYWETVMKVAKSTSLKRIMRTSQIMGRKDGEDMSAAQIMYPCMQTADIFTLGAQVTQLGMDQRKVNMFAREVGEELGFWKPVVISHHMLQGLSKPVTLESEVTIERTIEQKMSKSKPDSAIFMTDTKEDVERKIKKAFCPEGEVENNPIIEYCQFILFEKFDNLKVKRPQKWGGDVEFKNIDELKSAFSKRELHPSDLKIAVAEKVNELLEPVRQHFENNSDAKELLEKVKSFQVTR